MSEETAQADPVVPESFQEFADSLEEPGWMAGWRADAYALYREAPLPIRADHLWRYTDPALFLPVSDPFALGGGRDGNAADIPDSLARAGVTCIDFQTAARQCPARLQEILGSTVGPEHGKFEALNAASFRSGLLLHVPKGVVLDEPLYLAHAFSHPGFSALRLAVLVEDGASLKLIYELTGGPEQAGLQVSAVTEMRAGAGARVHFATLQTLSRKVNLHLTQRAVLGEGAVCLPAIASFGGALTKIDTGVILEGTGSESEMAGFVSAVGRQKFDHHTVHQHRGRRTRSDLDFKTVLQDRSRSVYTGLIRIEAEAAYAEAYQENRNLLLSGESRADSIPELEILNQEVQCKHGATVGPIDPEHLFYLMSRGIPEPEAVVMIIEGHFEPTLRKLPPATQERLRGILRDRLRVR